MHLSVILIAVLVTASFTPRLASAAAPADQPATHTSKGAKPDAAPAAPAIDYDDLGSHVGERIAVRTTFKSTRVGVLARFSKIELALAIDTPSGPTELTIPRDTIVSIVAAQTPAPAKH